MRRPFHIALHWANSFLIIAALVSGGEPIWLTSFGIVAVIWSAMALGLGLSGRPSPALTGAFRPLHTWGHRALYVLVGVTGLAALGVPVLASFPVRELLLTLIAIGSLHAVFHLWRHTTLGDNALNNILPKFLHGIL